MSKRYLGIICLLYSGIFAYVVIFDKLKLFLAPRMQIYIKLSIIPMLLIGLIMLFNNKVSYKFKISDLILLLPIILLILSGDGRLTSSFASNRTVNLKNRTKTEEEIQEIEETDINTYDFTTIDFDITDASYSGLSGYFNNPPTSAKKYIDNTIKIKGFALKEASNIPNGYFAIGKYEISCCAADAGFIGFIAKYDNTKIESDKWYEIEGVIKKGKDADNYDILYIKVINIKEINAEKEEQYVYPCYAYDNGRCEAMSKYNLEY